MPSKLYIEIRDEVAVAIATATFSYSANGIVVGDKIVNRKEFFDKLPWYEKEKYLVQAQAAMDVFNGHTYEVVAAESWNAYLEEK